MSQRRFSVRYIILFSLAVCGVCAVFVSSLAVTLAPMQEKNQLLDRRKNVLLAAGDVQAGEKITADKINELFNQYNAKVIDLATGDEMPEIDPSTFDQRKARKDPERSEKAPTNRSSIQRVPNNALIYEKLGADGRVEMVVLPIEGYGLWTTLYGFLALDKDAETIKGLAYYEHGETPGLGGEVDNPRWRALWPGRRVYGDDGRVKIEVIKGPAGPVAEDPYHVDGLSGATITSRGVTNMLDFWLGENGFKPYLEKLRQKGAA